MRQGRAERKWGCHANIWLSALSSGKGSLSDFEKLHIVAGSSWVIRVFGEAGGSRKMIRIVGSRVSLIGNRMVGRYKERELFCIRRKVETGRSGEACRLASKLEVEG